MLSCKSKQQIQTSIQESSLTIESTVDEDIIVDNNPDNFLDESSLRYLKLDISNTIGVVVFTPYNYNEEEQDKERDDVNICFLNDDGSV